MAWGVIYSNFLAFSLLPGHEVSVNIMTDKGLIAGIPIEEGKMYFHTASWNVSNFLEKILRNCFFFLYCCVLAGWHEVIYSAASGSVNIMTDKGLIAGIPIEEGKMYFHTASWNVSNFLEKILRNCFFLYCCVLAGWHEVIYSAASGSVNIMTDKGLIAGIPIEEGKMYFHIPHHGMSLISSRRYWGMVFFTVVSWRDGME